MLQVLRLLLQAKCDLHQTHRDGCTALHKAIANNHLECVKVLH